MEKRAKTGGRTKGTPNRMTARHRAWVIENGNPLEFLASVQRGDAISGEVPNLDQRIRVAGMLLDKILPDLKAVDADIEALIEAALPSGSW